MILSTIDQMERGKPRLDIFGRKERQSPQGRYFEGKPGLYIIHVVLGAFSYYLSQMLRKDSLEGY